MECQLITAVNVDDFVANLLKIYPVPVNDILTLEIFGNPSGYYRVLDVNGRELIPPVAIDNRKVSINVELLPRGIYFLELMQDGLTLHKTFMK